MKKIVLLILACFFFFTKAEAQCSVSTTPSGAVAIALGDSVTVTAFPTGTSPFSYSWTPSGGTTQSIIAKPTITTTFTVTVTDFASCVSDTTITVVINPIVTVSVNPNSSVCKGNCVPLSASGGSNYTWSPPDGLSSTTGCCPTACPTATVTYTVSNGTSTAVTIVTINPLPTITIGASDTSVCLGECISLTASGGLLYSWSNGQTGIGLSAITICPPLGTGSYTVTGVDANACSNSATVTVTVNPLPVITTNPINPHVCLGQCTTITASGGISYEWNNGSTTAFTTGCGGSYTVIVWDGNGCSSTATIPVILNPKPVVTVNPPISICTGACTFFSASGGIKYTWFPDSCLDDPNIPNPVTCCAGTYKVIVSDINGCSDSATTTVTMIPPPCLIGIDKSSDLNSLPFYPNPLSSSSTLRFNIQLKDAEVIIYDMLGKEMMRKKLVGDRMEIESRSFGMVSGVYFVKVNAEGKEFVQKLIVE